MLNDIFFYVLIKCHDLHPPVWSAVRVVFRVGSPRSSPCSAASSFPPFCAAEQDCTIKREKNKTNCIHKVKNIIYLGKIRKRKQN